MGSTDLILWGLIPAVLVVLGAILVQYAGGPVERGRLLLFWLEAGVLILLAILIASLFQNEYGQRLSWQAGALLTPALMGSLTMVLLHLPTREQLNRTGKNVAAGLGLALVVLVLVLSFGSQSFNWTLLGIPVVLAGGWTLARRSSRAAIGASIVCLGLMALMNLDTFNAYNMSGAPIFLLMLVGLFWFFLAGSLIVTLSAALLANSMRAYTAPAFNSVDPLPDTPDVAEPSPQRRTLGNAFYLGLSALLLAVLTLTIFWASVWDQTNDGLGGLALTHQATPAAVVAGMLMTITLPGRRKLLGALFGLFVPVLLTTAFNQGWAVSYHAITEARAGRIAVALESYHRRTGHYPAALGELAPRDILYIPQPVVFRGEPWCYQGEPDSYRLDLVYREYFGLPISLRTYASAGEAPSGEKCEAMLAEIKARYGPSYGTYEPVTSEPVLSGPVSTLEIEKTPLQPQLQGGEFNAGRWSADGRFLPILQLESSLRDSQAELYFLDAADGEICETGVVYTSSPYSAGLRERIAWLGNGRLLFLDPDGELASLQPCSAADTRALEFLTSEPLVKISAYDEQSGRVLLQSQTGYWLLDGEGLELRLIPGVSPNPYEFHWDNFAWLPGGELLAISRLNGQDQREGTTLYIVRGDSGEVLHSLPIEGSSDQSSPWVEWLMQSMLMVSGNNPLLLDFSTVPPGQTQLIEEYLRLDITYPDQTSTFATLPDSSGRSFWLGLRLNHRRSHAIHLYDSLTGQVQVLQPEGNAILVFPGGEAVEMRKLETGEPSYADTYEVIWVNDDQPEAKFHVPGHTPRDYPDLSVAVLPEQMLAFFGSSQGVSLHTLPGGELVEFWELPGGRMSPWLIAAPQDQGLAIIVTGLAGVAEGAVYWMPLETGQ